MPVPRALRLALLGLALLFCVEVILFSVGWVRHQVDGTTQTEFVTTAQSLTHSIARRPDGQLHCALAPGSRPSAQPCPT
jgi:hypothetical protein